ncbi:MAG: M48 family metalloprotease [Gammaproteobacteria bacterium]|nr:M48 family metalloprotease [Gammaproteobacteria bacterium]
MRVLALGLGRIVLIRDLSADSAAARIKAAVSRQREFLADASAVQFTRNPGTIAGALKRIGGYSGGSVLDNPEAEEMSHAFFSQGVTGMFTSLLATHPPLDERISRIDPNWDGGFNSEVSPEPTADEFDSVNSVTSGFAAAGATTSRAGNRTPPRRSMKSANRMRIGCRMARDVSRGKCRRRSKRAAREASSARAVV